jgi:hypothetical protein
MTNTEGDTVPTTETTYKIVRYYRDDRPAQVINTGFTLEQAQRHCNDEKTAGKDWFDGFTAEGQ